MNDLNLRAALFSFLRVLLVAEASAYLALTTGEEPITWQALGLAAASALALSVVNFFRPGEPRFGPEPKVDDAGAGELRLIAVVACGIVAGIVLWHLLREVVTAVAVG